MPHTHPPAPPPMTRFTVHFRGNVQGVGFRYTTAQIASRYPVTGFVENLPDGRVRLVAEADREQLGALVREILQWMNRHVREHTIDEGPATGEFGRPGLDRLKIRR
jgi:acylphosphatase